MWKRALISVSDKTGLVEFLKPLTLRGLEIVSTGGTAEHLRQAGLKVTDVSEVTGFPEILDGRVKTLHPKVHMGLLGRPDEKSHVQSLQDFSVEFFDLVIVNLYPFEEAFKKGYEGRALIEKIDVGGPTMLRSAAKNFEFITVVVDPRDYRVLSENHQPSLEQRKALAAKVFAHTSAYDSLIALALDTQLKDPKTWTARPVQKLRYGENPQQEAHWFARTEASAGLHQAQILQGKELSYNNILDLDAALALCARWPQPAAVAVKHNNPCGVAESQDSFDAVLKCLQSDPVSVFGGIVAINRTVTGRAAEELSKIFLECVIAPDFDTEALKIFEKKKNLRILKLPLFNFEQKEELRSVYGGFLTQSADLGTTEPSTWKFIGQKPDSQIMADFAFGERVGAALKSNAIAIVGGGQTFGLGMGQVNRVDAVKHALERYHKFHSGKKAVLVSDAFFPFSDSIEEIAKAGIRWVLQPGGSVKDEEVFKRAEELGVNLAITGQRHFRH
jgi:phosphoribosylaminoimidazolecarboxamide formyltransferase/IMP cyclohydrolase